MQLDSRLRFETYVTGSANRLAVSAARAVAEQPGLTYNPLFIYSGSGLGKTHLMTAIGNLVQQRDAKLGVEYVTLEDFVEQLHAAIASNETDRFKQRYGRVDVLLLDDMQFLTGRRETQTELLRLLNALQGTGRQVVMTSDRPPAEIPDVDERLITRLSGGLIVDIGAPDYETRIAILRARCEERRVTFQAGVLEELAGLPFGNIRELNGALNKLIATQTLGDSDVAPAQVKAMFPHLAPRTSGPRGRAGRLTPGTNMDFQSFVSDIATTVAETVDPWKIKVAEAVAYWSEEGYRVASLERLLQSSAPRTDYEAALREYFAAIEELRTLEGRVTAVDPALGTNDVFRDPERLAEARSVSHRTLTGAAPPQGPSPALTRSAFQVGSGNQLAVRAADAVAQDPGRRYNPLFIHGPEGAGKTHLVNALGNELINTSGGASVVACVSASRFMDELIDAMQEGQIDRFRSRYRSVDALIVDDVQFIAGKERTQEELFHLFNTLFGEGKQLVFASDRAPRQLDGVEARLRSRFEGGLVVEMLDGRGATPGAGVTRPPTPASPAPAATEPARSTAEYFLDEEKIVWHLADLGALLIEDPR